MVVAEQHYIAEDVAEAEPAPAYTTSEELSIEQQLIEATTAATEYKKRAETAEAALVANAAELRRNQESIATLRAARWSALPIATAAAEEATAAASLSARPLLATSARPLARDMSTKIVATVFGQDREGVMADFSRVVLGVGGTIGGSRAITVSGTFNLSAVVFLPEEDTSLVADFSWALQTALPNYVTGIRPAVTGDPPKVFCRLDVESDNEYGLIAQIADHIKSRGFSFASLRTHQKVDSDGDPIFTCVAVIMHPPGKEVDVVTVEKEFYEMGEKLDVKVNFSPYV